MSFHRREQAAGTAETTELRRQRRRLLGDAHLYLCTPARTGQGDLREFLDAAYRGGVDIIQLRDKSLDVAGEIAALEVLASVAAEHGKLFAVNDRADVAALVGADIFHIGQDDLSVDQARHLLGPDVLVGRSTHCIEQAATAAQDEGVDYFCTGPVWETPTKPGRAATGLGFVADAAGMTGPGHDTVWFAIGGVNEDTLPEVLDAGARRAVVVRAITEAHDPAAAAAALASQLRGTTPGAG